MTVSAASAQSAGRATPRPLVLHGIGVAPGIVIARALVFQHQEAPLFRVPLLRSEVGGELLRLEGAKDLTRRQILEIRARTVEALGEDHGYIFDAHSLMLDDPLVAGRIEEVIREERVNAEWAAQLVLNELSTVFDDLEDDYFRARRSDVYDVIGRLMRNLAGAPHRSLEKLDRKYILLSDDVRPSDTARLDWEHMAGLAMEAGSRTYHTAIIARSLGIPCVVGVRELTAKVDHGAPLILDGGEGIVVVNPDRATIRDYRARKRRHVLLKQKLEHLRELPAETTDGYRIVLQANVEFPEECETAKSQGAQGIGLFRSEWFLTRSRGQFPTEDEQYRVYRSLAEEVRPWSVIVRAFDLSAEQLGDETARTEANPALGLRAIRLLLKRRDLFKEQLRALLRARAHGNVKVM
ncbi:MAG TPA: putative PEP-binding protein, partial [Vicinamibacteria bacterium]|nr:putative PEP-binding protein [Vicinamibacteria bacterium]